MSVLEYSKDGDDGAVKEISTSCDDVAELLLFLSHSFPKNEGGLIAQLEDVEQGMSGSDVSNDGGGDVELENSGNVQGDETMTEERVVAEVVKEDGMAAGEMEAAGVREDLNEEALMANEETVDAVAENDVEEHMVEDEEKSLDTEMETEEEATLAAPGKTIEEDVCFICFDGGDLVLCDLRNCPKAYHPSCFNRDEAFFHSKRCWNCGVFIPIKRQGSTQPDAAPTKKQKKGSGEVKVIPNYDTLLTNFTETAGKTLSVARQQRIVEVAGVDLRRNFLAAVSEVATLGLKLSLEHSSQKSKDEFLDLQEKLDVAKGKTKSLEDKVAELDSSIKLATDEKFKTLAGLRTVEKTIRQLTAESSTKINALEDAIGARDAELADVRKELGERIDEVKALNNQCDDTVVALCGHLLRQYPDLDFSFHAGLAEGAAEAREMIARAAERRATREAAEAVAAGEGSPDEQEHAEESPETVVNLDPEVEDLAEMRV